jgi:peptidoglycan/LPS O-acetylase OafA/YrhL
MHTSSRFSDTKPHYLLLDALRGVAAIMVVIYHFFEAFPTSPFDQRFNHGYMGVDFFFVLSGFVIGYAYDDRWKSGKFTLGKFFKRRLIRLHPMVILGAVIGMVTFFIQGGVQWDGTQVPVWHVIIALVCTMLLIPAVPGTSPEVRGNGEMYPLNGPYWSLFFEYIGNILYALCIRRLSTKKLAVLVWVLGIGLAAFALMNGSDYGHIGVGWTMAGNNFWGGLLRMSFSYTAGMFISRIFRPMKIKGAFWICSAALFALMAVPHLGADGNLWLNGLYDSVCVLFLFPLILYIGACGSVTAAGGKGEKVWRFLGDISYPLYMIHYPFMYLFYAWCWEDGKTIAQTWPVMLGIFFGCIALAYIVLKLYDEPVRKWLSRQ